MKFKVGDKVRVREDLEINKMCGNYEFIKEMVHLKGEIVTIKEVLKSGYRIEEEYYMWTDEMLEEVKSEAKEKTFREVIADIKKGEVWESHCKRIIGVGAGVFRIENKNGEDIGSYVAVNVKNKYRLQRKEYTFEEAFKAYEEGKVIESCVTGDKYTWNGFADLICKNGSDGYHKLKSIYIEEIKGKWHINN